MSVRIGILGAGQLGRMLALAGYPLGLSFELLDQSAGAPGGALAPVTEATLDDAEAAAALAKRVDVVTLEIENVSPAVLEAAARHAPVYPPAEAVGIAQDRLTEKELFRSLGIPTAPYVSVDSRSDLARAASTLGFPLVIKTRRLGYDGRGQRIVHAAAGLESAFAELGEAPSIAEGWVPHDRELSLVAVQGANRERAFYPLVQNVHREGILEVTRAPYADADLQRLAESWLGALFDRLDYRGVLTVELFHAGGRLLVNEMAPRVHNSGHWTIEGAVTSQFENHLRAVAGWPLGETRALGHAAMVNLLGDVPPAAAVLGIPGAHLHLYGKSPKPKRKLGHCTLVDTDPQRLEERLTRLGTVTGVAVAQGASRNA